MEGGAREGTIAVVENCVVVLFGSGLLLGSLSVTGMYVDRIGSLFCGFKI